MGENNGIIWILVAVIVLGVAVFSLGNYFAGSVDSDKEKMAFSSEAGVNEARCKITPTNKYTTYDTAYENDIFKAGKAGTTLVPWTSGDPTGICTDGINETPM
ncbi:MAG: hypothetical protein ACK5HR_05560 [Mycoplasmatales bacterium]